MVVKAQDTEMAWDHGDLIQEGLLFLVGVTEDNIVIIIHKMMIGIVHGEQEVLEVIQIAVTLMEVTAIMVQ